MKTFINDFPLLQHHTGQGNRICYLDNASTSQKPQSVIDSLVTFYSTQNANVGRGVYRLAEQATQLYEDARATVAKFIGAQPHEIVFTLNATAGIQIVAESISRHLVPGDEILISQLEHHSNMMPWQKLVRERGIILKYIPVLPNGMLAMNEMSTLISSKTKLIAVTHISNALGTVVDVAAIGAKAKAVGALFLVDACQSVGHERIAVHKLGADFLVFSGHKMLGPTGVGVLYINEKHHDLPPVARGGGTVFEADWFDATWVKAPHKFEAGTPPIAQAIGLSVAIDYLVKNVNFAELKKYEAGLCARLIDGLSKMPKIRVLGPVEQLNKEGHLVSFVVENMHSHDVAAFLDKYGICVRAGHFCAQPLAKKLGYQSAIRASFYIYNTPEDVDKLLSALAGMFLE